MSTEEKANLKSSLRNAIENGPDKKYIRKASIFGSYAYGEPRPDSDVDLLVELEDDEKLGLFEYVEIQRRLGQAIGKKIDMLTPESLSKYFRDFVVNNSELVYER